MTKIVLHKCKVCGPIYDQDKVYVFRRPDGGFNSYCKTCQARRTYVDRAMSRANLDDAYVKITLGFNSKTEVPKDLLDLKRATLKIKRTKRDMEKSELEAWAKEFYLEKRGE